MSLNLFAFCVTAFQMNKFDKYRRLFILPVSAFFSSIRHAQFLLLICWPWNGAHCLLSSSRVCRIKAFFKAGRIKIASGVVVLEAERCADLWLHRSLYYVLENCPRKLLYKWLQDHCITGCAMTGATPDWNHPFHYIMRAAHLAEQACCTPVQLALRRGLHI